MYPKNSSVGVLSYPRVTSVTSENLILSNIEVKLANVTQKRDSPTPKRVPPADVRLL